MQRLILSLILFAAFAGAQTTQTPRVVYCTTTRGATIGGTANAVTCTPSPAITSYIEDTIFEIEPASNNTSGVTLNVSGLGALDVVKPSGGITTALVADDWRTGQKVQAVYDGTRLQMRTLTGNAASGGSGKTIFIATPAGTVGSSASVWFAITGGSTTPTSPGTSRRTVLSTSGTFVASSARLHVGGAFPAGNTTVCTLLIDAADTSLTLTVPASAASGDVISGAGSNASYTAGQTTSWRCTNNVAATSGTISSISIDFTY
jgi:hypothetical protein